MEKGRHSVAALVFAGVIQLLACVVIYIFNIPNPNIVLFVLLSAVLVRYGYGAGTVCGVITFLYTAFFFSTDHSWVSYTPINRDKLIVVTLGIVANIGIVGHMQKASESKTRRIARLETEKELSRAAAERESQMFHALCANYSAAYLCDLKKNTMTLIKEKPFSHSAQAKKALKGRNSYTDWVQYCYENLVVKEESPNFQQVFDPENLMQRLDKQESFSYRHRTVPNKAGMQYFETNFVRLHADAESYEIIIGYGPIDDMIAEEKAQNRKLQEALAEANRANQAKSVFFLNMSHDIRTPLNGIIGLLKINETHGDDRELVMENCQKMEKAANHLLSLVNDVLQMSKLESGTEKIVYEPTRLADVSRDISAMIKESATEGGISWKFSGDRTPVYPYVMTSPLHLRQIFLNIYGNSIKFTKPGGTISTRQEFVKEENGTVTYRWIISDTGIGMSQEFLKHIFEPFAQEKNDARSSYHGTGLGMSIVKNLVEKMDGTISVTSQEGAGSTFVLTMPFAVAEAPEPKQPAPEAVDVGIQGLHLMLAEDNALNAEIAQTLLEDAGAKITLVTNGQQAVDLFDISPAGTFDAILMDVMMPVMDGLTATKTIRALNRPDAKTIPIIAVTANAFAEDAQKCLAAGMNAHLSKPLDLPKVKQVIAAQVQAQRSLEKQ